MNRRNFLRFVASGIVLLSGVLAATLCTSGRAQSAAASVRLIVDYGDGSIKLFTDLPWSNGATVLDVMNAAKGHAHGITFNFTGSGASAFVTEIDGVANQRGGSDKKNWQYWVNTSYGDRSFAVWPVQALDTVTWRFAAYQGK